MEITTGLGKGLREPCGPEWREAYFFGAELNQVSADYWNCPPLIVGPSTSFDLSTLKLNHEALVALLAVRDALAGEYHISFEWYRERDDVLLFDYSFDHTALEGGWLYAYSYIGYVDWEISENGDYSVEIRVRGAKSYSKTISFTVSGIPEVPPEPVPSRDFISSIIDRLNAISSFFWSIEQEVSEWVFPFSLIAYPLSTTSLAFNTLAWNFRDFSLWIYDITDRAKDILSWDTIWSLIRSHIPNLEAIRDWFTNRWAWLNTQISNWWSETGATVAGWIEASKDWARLWIDYLEGRANSLQAAWDNFTTVTLPSLPSWVDINALFASWAKSFEPFWEGWQDVREAITEFIKDPLQWFYDRLDEIFERFW